MYYVRIGSTFSIEEAQRGKSLRVVGPRAGKQTPPSLGALASFVGIVARTTLVLARRIASRRPIKGAAELNTT